MDMSMPMSMPMPSATTTTMDMATSAPHSDMEMMPMGMSTTFSTSTKVTLFFNGWTTNTVGQYIGTLIFVFFVTILNRFLGAWRSQLSRKWADEAAVARKDHERKRKEKKLEKQKFGGAREALHGHRKSGSLAQNLDPSIDDEVMPLTPVLKDSEIISAGSSNSNSFDRERHSTEDEEAQHDHAHDPAVLRGPKWTEKVSGTRWMASNPFRPQLDGPRALLEGVRALIGYLLMLAVMTFNVGLFVTILAGIVVGEFLLGRYTTGAGWEEGGCHDG